MSVIEMFNSKLSVSEQALLAQLSTPCKIQTYLDQLAYSTESIYRCPLRVLRDQTAHCFDGALFAAAALRQIGYPPLILELIPNNRDDDHLLAPFIIDGYWGAVAKSNFVGLRYREPIHRNLRELVLSYFEQFYNVAHEKTLRAYMLPLNLKIFDRFNWMSRDDQLDRIADALDQKRKIPVITESMSQKLSLVDERSFQSGLSGSVEAGLYKP